MENDSEQNHQSAENDERPTPAIVLSDGAGEEAARDGSDVNAGLMDAHGARTGGGAVIIANHRHGSRIVDRLSKAFGGAEEEQLGEIARKGSEGANQAPGLKAGEKSEVALEQREDGEDGLAIGVIE